jgi:hypothetical protein
MPDEETPVEVNEPNVDVDVADPPLSAAVHEVALEVIAGHWGRGQVRQRRLEDAGWDPKVVQEEVAKIMNQ